MENKNEFDEMYNADEFNDSEDVLSTDTKATEDLIAGGEDGLEYDTTKAPTTTKGPERVNLDGKEVVITSMKVFLPKYESAWQTAKKDKSVRYKTCQFILYYDNDGQREYYSGLKVFPRLKDGKELYSDPTIHNSASNQASELKKVYAKYKGKKPEEISMHEFFAFLGSKPKALIEAQEFEYDGTKTKKNIVVKFL